MDGDERRMSSMDVPYAGMLLGRYCYYLGIGKSLGVKPLGVKRQKHLIESGKAMASFAIRKANLSLGFM